MKKNRILYGLASVAAVAILGACAQFMHNDGEKVVALDQTPPAVQAAIGKALAGQKADKIVMENDEGKPTYEVVYHVNGQECSAEFTATGDLVEQESDVEASSLPSVVTGAIMQKYPSAKITEAAQVTSGGQHFYEAGIKLSDGKEREVQVNGDGSIRSDKAEEAEKAD